MGSYANVLDGQSSVKLISIPLVTRRIGIYKGIVDFAEEVLKSKPDTITVKDLEGKSPQEMVDYLMTFAQGVYKGKAKATL